MFPPIPHYCHSALLVAVRALRLSRLDLAIHAICICHPEPLGQLDELRQNCTLVGAQESVVHLGGGYSGGPVYGLPLAIPNGWLYGIEPILRQLVPARTSSWNCRNWQQWRCAH
jgi:hypothetical protein